MRHFSQTNSPFINKPRCGYPIHIFRKYFKKILNLFTKDNFIEIFDDNSREFYKLAEMMQIKSLQDVCDNVSQFASSQHFFLSSDNFQSISNFDCSLFNNFSIQLSQEVINCNYVFASLISNKIFRMTQINSSSSINLSEFPHPEIISSLFKIFEGSTFSFNDFNSELLIQTFLYLEVNISKFISLLTSFNSIQICLSSNLLHIQNENFLLDFIFNKINENKIYIDFIQNILLGACNKSLMTKIIYSLQFNEISSSLFIHLKESFCSNYILNDDFFVYSI